MNQNAKQILSIIEQFITKNPQQRFTQALFNLGITEFADPDNNGQRRHVLRDFYNDTDDEVLERIAKLRRDIEQH